MVSDSFFALHPYILLIGVPLLVVAIVLFFTIRKRRKFRHFR